MEMVDISAMAVGLITLFTGLFMFFKNNKKQDSIDGERWGRLETMLEYIRKDVEYTKDKVNINAQKHELAIDKLRNEVNGNISALNDRLTNHLMQDHNFNKGGRYGNGSND